MQKITAILAVIEDSTSGAMVLDKAESLARCFGAHLDLLVTDPRIMSEITSRCATIGYDNVTLRSARRTDEALNDLLLRRVRESCPDLLIKAPSSPNPLSTWTLQENDRVLARDCPIPLLLTGPRPWNMALLRFAAAVDVSDSESALTARSVLQSAGFLALGARARLDVLYCEREQVDETLRMERAVRVAQYVREFHVGCERLQVFDGNPEERLPRLVAHRQYDVLVLGAVSHRNSVAFRTLTSRLVDATPGDVLLVKPPEHAAAKPHSRRSIGREQIPHDSEEIV